MRLFLCLVILGVSAVCAQENSMANVPKSLLECYNDTYLLDKNNKLPHNVPALLAILRKIEDTPGLNMDLRQLSVALLHRFRQDGIMQNPFVPAQTGVTPYAPNGFQFYRQSETLKLIPGNAISFPNNSISGVERCSLHSMFSSSIDFIERGDEANTCRVANSAYRYARHVEEKSRLRSRKYGDDEVETLTAEQLETMNNKEDSKDTGIDPNSWYPPLPPNHPDNMKLFAPPPQSKCPVENGVLKTSWGNVAGGSIIAGIAAGLEPQNVKLGVLLKEEWQSHDTLSETTLDNKWIATIAGDLAEVALRQGPLANKPLTLGVDGHWNSSYMPRWYFLNSNEDLFYTAAEIRGDLDGLIMASEVAGWYNSAPSLRLSQIIDMYYSDRGVFNASIRACNRKNLLVAVAPNNTITAQAFRSALVLSPGVAKVTIDPATIEKFAVQASEKLFSFIPSMKDPMCNGTSDAQTYNRISTNLTIILDTKWPFATIQPILAALLESLDVSKYNSRYTILSGYNGTVMINSTDSILDFYEFNETRYSSYMGDFNLPRAFDTIISMQASRLNEEQRTSRAGGNSEVVLIVPYTSGISAENKEYCKERMWTMYEDLPDVTLMFLATGAKDSWSEFVRNQNHIVLVSASSAQQDISLPIDSILSSIQKVPKRLKNSACDANWAESGSTASYEDYLEPSGINFYRLHPNYFWSADGDKYATINFQGSASTKLVICTSRDPLDVDSPSSDCHTVSGGTQSLQFTCSDATFIHDCHPLYLSVKAKRSQNAIYECRDPHFCRYPDMIKYKISYENLVCVNGATSVVLSPIILAIFILYAYLH